MIEEIKNEIDQLGKAWSEFKDANEQRLSQIEKKGASDPLTEEKVNKINSHLSDLQEKQEKMAAVLNRPNHTPADVKKTKQDAELKVMNTYFKDLYGEKNLHGYLNTHQDAEVKSVAMTASSNVDGGYVNIGSFEGLLTANEFEQTVIRDLARTYQGSTGYIELAQKTQRAQSSWTTEQGTRPRTDSFKLGKTTIMAHEIFAYPAVSNTMLEDSEIDIANEIIIDAREEFMDQEGEAFVSGDGVGKPRGFLSYPNVTTPGVEEFGKIEQFNSGSNANIDSDLLIRMFYALKGAYRKNASWLMDRSTIELARRLKRPGAGSDDYLWEPNYQTGQPANLLGRPVREESNMPQAAIGSLSVALADWSRAYSIYDRIGQRVIRDEVTNPGFVNWYIYKRVGGDVTNFEAIKLMNLSA